MQLRCNEVPIELKKTKTKEETSLDQRMRKKYVIPLFLNGLHETS
jgi:hypothetical protein